MTNKVRNIFKKFPGLTKIENMGGGKYLFVFEIGESVILSHDEMDSEVLNLILSFENDFKYLESKKHNTNIVY